MDDVQAVPVPDVSVELPDHPHPTLGVKLPGRSQHFQTVVLVSERRHEAVTFLLSGKFPLKVGKYLGAVRICLAEENWKQVVAISI